jgi:hypothetical protein
MKSTQYLRLAALAAAVSLAACSGGSDGGGDSTLTISLMDAPVDDVTEVNVQIAALWLKATGDGPAVQLPLANAPVTVDLLELTEENAAVLIDGAVVEAGSYEWLAMDVNAEFDNVFDSYVMNTSGGMEELHVPSGRVRLVSGFEIEANQAVELLFDWDLRKGLVDPIGQPGFVLKPAFRVIDVTEYGALGGTIAMGTVTAPASDCNADDTTGMDYDLGNVVYVYSGLNIVPNDVDGTDFEPFATVEAAPNTAGDYEYRTLLAPGDYTVAFTCQAGNDNPEADDTGNADPLDDTVAFFAPVNVTISADAETTVDF